MTVLRWMGPACVLTVTCSGYDGNSTKLSKILLNGNNICMVWLVRFPLASRNIPLTCFQLIPGGEGPAAAQS